LLKNKQKATPGSGVPVRFGKNNKLISWLPYYKRSVGVQCYYTKSRL